MRTIILLLLFPLMMAVHAQQSLDKALDALIADKLFDTGDVSLMVYDLTTVRRNWCVLHRCRRCLHLLWHLTGWEVSIPLTQSCLGKVMTLSATFL